MAAAAWAKLVHDNWLRSRLPCKRMLAIMSKYWRRLWALRTRMRSVMRSKSGCKAELMVAVLRDDLHTIIRLFGGFDLLNCQVFGLSQASAAAHGIAAADAVRWIHHTFMAGNRQ